MDLGQIDRLNESLFSLNTRLEKIGNNLELLIGSTSTGAKRAAGQLADELERIERSTGRAAANQQKNVDYFKLQEQAARRTNEIFKQGSDAVERQLRALRLVHNEKVRVGGKDVPLSEVQGALNDPLNTNRALSGQVFQEMQLAETRRMQQRIADQQKLRNMTQEQTDSLGKQAQYLERQQKTRDNLKRISDKELEVQLRMNNMLSKGQVNYSTISGGQGRLNPISLSALRGLRAKQRNGTLTPDEADQLRDVEEDLARRSNTETATRGRTASVKDILTALTRGDIGGALSEGVQAIPGTERLRGRLSGFAEGGMLQRLLAGGAARLLTPAGIGAVGYAAVQALNYRRQITQLGQVTGEGFGAGIAARREAFLNAGGLNPFDMITRAMSEQIVAGIRSQGFKGAVGTAMSSAVADSINDLGISVEDALRGMKVQQDAWLASTGSAKGAVQAFREEMSNLDDVAKATNLSIQQVTQSTLTYQEQIAGAAGPQAAITAGTTFPALIQTLGRGAQITPEQLMGFSQFAITRYGGLPPWMANASQGQRMIGQLLDRVTELVLQMKETIMPEATLDTFVNYFVFSGLSQSFFPGMRTDQIVALLRRKRGLTDRGKTFTSQMRADVASDAAQRADDAREHAEGGFLGMFKDTGAGQRAFVRTFREQLSRGGVSRQAQNRLLATYQTALEERRTQEQSINPRLRARMDLASPEEYAQRQVQQVMVKLDPAAKQYFTAGNTSYNEWVRGTGRSQGTIRP